jgi:sensor histidine kinase YesM
MPAIIDKQRLKLYGWMCLGYSAFVMLEALVNSPGTFWTRTVNNAWLIIYVLVNNYILLEYTIPFISTNWKRMLLLPFFIFIHMMFYSFGIYAWRLIGTQLHIYTPIGSFKSTKEALGFFTGYSMGSVFFFAIIRHIYNYVRLKQATQQLRIEKQAAELNYLKSQTNPHFLFNTLNNIYSLAKDKSDLAPESILRLSKILRFMLYETSGEYIAVEQELKVMSDYIALEKLRYDDSLSINFNHDVEDMKQALPPLLLIPLVENAFKHGVSETRNSPFVDIHLSINKRQILFIVKNSAEADPGERVVKENIGLTNLRRQLALLYKDFNLSVKQDVSTFTATLKINLASHV